MTLSLQPGFPPLSVPARRAAGPLAERAREIGWVAVAEAQGDLFDAQRGVVEQAQGVAAARFTTTPVHFNAFETRIDGPSGGYDRDRLGWRYDVMDCGDGGQGIPYYTCQPAQDVPPEIQWGADLLLGGLLWPTWLVPPPVGERSREDRMVFNTLMYSKRNRGHEWTRGLTDPERRALVEYLETL